MKITAACNPIRSDIFCVSIRIRYIKIYVSIRSRIGRFEARNSSNMFYTFFPLFSSSVDDCRFIAFFLYLFLPFFTQTVFECWSLVKVHYMKIEINYWMLHSCESDSSATETQAKGLVNWNGTEISIEIVLVSTPTDLLYILKCYMNRPRERFCYLLDNI